MRSAFPEEHLMRTLGAIAIATLATTMTTAQSSSRQVVNNGPNLNLPFSSAIKAGGLIYASGTVAVDAKGNVIAGDIRAQTKQTLDNLASTLNAAGTDIKNAVSVMVYLTDAADFAAMNEVYRTYWPTDPPARTTVVAPLALPAAHVEISIVAVPAGGERTVIHPADWIKSP